MLKSICSKNSTLKDVLQAINEEPVGIAFLVDDKGVLCGILTDGDVRRLLLKGRQLSDNIMPADIGSYVAAKQGESVKDLMSKTDKRVRIIPIIDNQGKPIDFFRYEHKTHFTPVAEPSFSSKELQYLTDAFLSTWISSKGKYIDRFETEFSSYCDSKYGVAVANGTVAIHLALEALGVGEGDEVIVPDLTFAATINAVLYSKATPVIVDVDVERWTISPNAIRQALSPKTKAIIPVHLYGIPCDMDAIMAIAGENNLFVIEDCAEAHGAKYKGKKVGSFGDVSTFSFYGNKVITTGEGGMCITNSKELDTKMRVLRDHGMSTTKRYWHDRVGYNYRMTNLQAAIGCAQLERIDEILLNHKKIENSYKQALGNDASISWPADTSDIDRIVWLVSLTTSKKEVFIEKLKENNIDVRPFFYCLSQMPIYKKYAPRSCANALHLSDLGLNLPTVPNVDYKKVAQIYKDL